MPGDYDLPDIVSGFVLTVQPTSTMGSDRPPRMLGA